VKERELRNFKFKSALVAAPAPKAQDNQVIEEKTQNFSQNTVHRSSDLRVHTSLREATAPVIDESPFEIASRAEENVPSSSE